MVIPFKNTQIFYTSSGTGKPLVLLHGFLESHLIWNRLALEVSRHRQVICIDLPGHGLSGCISAIHTMELMAEAVYSVLKHLGKSKATFIGHSMGGYVTLAFEEIYPGIIEKLVLLNSTPAADSAEKRENRNRGVALVKKNKPAFIRISLMNLLTENNREKFKNEIELLQNQAVDFSSEGITAALEGMKIRKDRKNILKDFSYKKFFVAGTSDPVLDFTELQRVAVTCEAEIIPCSGGHLTILESYSEFLKFVYFIE